MRSGFFERIGGAALVALLVSTFALTSCSGAQSGYAPPEMPAGSEPVQQTQSVNGVPSGDDAPIQQGVPQDGESLGAEIPNEPPPDQASPPQQDPVPNGPQPRSAKIAPATVASTTPHCVAETLPGTYTTIFAQGRVTGTTFTAVTGGGASTWERLSFVVDKHGTAKAPAPAHSSYVYSGTYTVTNAKQKVDTVGCITLVATQSGASMKPSKFAAQSSASPFFGRPARSTYLTSGSVTKLAITGLSKSGGSGTFVLSNKFTGTIRLTSRTTVP